MTNLFNLIPKELTVNAKTTTSTEEITTQANAANAGNEGGTETVQFDMPPQGKALILHPNKNSFLVDEKTLTDRLNSRFFKPAWKYGVGTLMVLVGAGAGYAGGVYVTNRKHAKAADSNKSPVNADVSDVSNMHSA